MSFSFFLFLFTLPALTHRIPRTIFSVFLYFSFLTFCSRLLLLRPISLMISLSHLHLCLYDLAYIISTCFPLFLVWFRLCLMYDEVRRVCKTPGDPSGSTSAVAFSLDLTFVSFLFLTMLYTNVRHFFLSFANWIRSFNESLVTLLMSSIHRIRGFPFHPCSCSYSQHYIFLQGLMCPHQVSEILHFQHFVHGF